MIFRLFVLYPTFLNRKVQNYEFVSNLTGEYSSFMLLCVSLVRFLGKKKFNHRITKVFIEAHKENYFENRRNIYCNI